MLKSNSTILFVVCILGMSLLFFITLLLNIFFPHSKKKSYCSKFGLVDSFHSNPSFYYLDFFFFFPKKKNFFWFKIHLLLKFHSR